MKYKLENEKAFSRDDLMFDIKNETDEKIIQGLKSFDEQCIETWGDEWEMGYLTLINEDDWIQYAEDMFDDMYDVRNKELSFYRYVDYEKFTQDLRYYYSTVFLGNTMFSGRN